MNNTEIEQSVADQDNRNLLLKTIYGSGERAEDQFDTKIASKSAKNKKLRKKATNLPNTLVHVILTTRHDTRQVAQGTGWYYTDHQKLSPVHHP